MFVKGPPGVWLSGSPWVNTLRPRQNGRHFADDIFICIFVDENVWILVKISLNLFPRVQLTIFQPWFRLWPGLNLYPYLYSYSCSYLYRHPVFFGRALTAIIMHGQAIIWYLLESAYHDLTCVIHHTSKRISLRGAFSRYMCLFVIQVLTISWTYVLISPT